MFRCVDCGHLFEEGESASWSESRGEFWGSPCSETFSGCPLCKGEYEEVEPCKICRSYDHEAEEAYCEKCKESVKKRFSDFVEKEFTKEERKLLNELYDGVEI